MSEYRIYENGQAWGETFATLETAKREARVLFPSSDSRVRIVRVVGESETLAFARG